MTVLRLVKSVFKLVLRPFPHLNHFVRAHWSFHASGSELPYLREFCDPNEYSIDVGAAYGAVAYWLARHSSGVILIEPNPIFRRMLTSTFRGDRFIFVPSAASVGPGTATLWVPSNRLGRSTIDEKNSAQLKKRFSGLHRVDVDTVGLDRFADLSIGFIKIDVEGHEYGVLQGAKHLLASQRPNLLIEIEERHQQGSFLQVYELLSRHGYRCLALSDGHFSEVSPANFPSYQDPSIRYINNFFFTADRALFSRLVGAVQPYGREE